LFLFKKREDLGLNNYKKTGIWAWATLLFVYVVSLETARAASEKSNPPNSLEERLYPSIELPLAGRTLLINIPQFRAFLFEGQTLVESYPVAVGRRGWKTPTGEWTVEAIVKNPTWTPPESIRKEAEENGKSLPESVPPGPNNPLGHRAIYLEGTLIRIHGTNKPSSVPGYVSHGCIRLKPEDIELLSQKLKRGDRVVITYDPLVTLVDEGLVYAASFENVYRQDATYSKERLLELLSYRGVDVLDLDAAEVDALFLKRDGNPRLVGFVPDLAMSASP
jgi:lipoprotein-anchoring transpeptidase ErfK/SrfK